MEKDKILELLWEADAGTLNDVLLCALERYRELFPDQHIVLLTLPAEGEEERARIWKMAMEMELPGNFL